MSSETNEEYLFKHSFLCALFDDGEMMNVHETWIKKKISGITYEVYYPPKNTSQLINRKIPREKICSWDFMSADILCSHGNL